MRSTMTCRLCLHALAARRPRRTRKPTCAFAAPSPPSTRRRSSVKSRDGRDLKLALPENATVAVAKAVRFDEIKDGDFVGATTKRGPDGSGSRRRSALPAADRQRGPERMGPRAQLEDDQCDRAGEGRRAPAITSSRCSIRAARRRSSCRKASRSCARCPARARTRSRASTSSCRRRPRRRRAHRAAHPGQQGRRAAAAVDRVRAQFGAMNELLPLPAWHSRCCARRRTARTTRASSASRSTSNPTTPRRAIRRGRRASRSPPKYDRLLASSNAEDITRARDLIAKEHASITPMTMMVLAIRLYDVGPARRRRVLVSTRRGTASSPPCASRT